MQFHNFRPISKISSIIFLQLITQIGKFRPQNRMQLVSSRSRLRTIIILHPLGQFLIFHIIISLLQKLAQMRFFRLTQPFPSSVQHLMCRRHFFHAVKLRIGHVININIPRRRIVTTQNCVSLFHAPTIFIKLICRFDLRIRNIEHFSASV